MDIEHEVGVENYRLISLGRKRRRERGSTGGIASSFLDACLMCLWDTGRDCQGTSGSGGSEKDSL